MSSFLLSTFSSSSCSLTVSSLLFESSFSLELLELSHPSLISFKSTGTFSELVLGNEGEPTVVAAVATFDLDHKPIPHFDVVVAAVTGTDGMGSSLFESAGAAELWGGTSMSSEPQTLETGSVFGLSL